jgi:hypothetical protein
MQGFDSRSVRPKNLRIRIQNIVTTHSKWVRKDVRLYLTFIRTLRWDGRERMRSSIHKLNLTVYNGYADCENPFSPLYYGLEGSGHCGAGGGDPDQSRHRRI